MKYPRLLIDVSKLEQNVRLEVSLLARHGIETMGVNKVFNGLADTAGALVRGGVQVVAESRVENLAKLAHFPCRTCLLRSPSLSEVDEVVRHADISLASDPDVLRALSRAAVRQQRRHEVMLMVDMGDLREGIWHEDADQLAASVELALELPGLSVHGLGTNFNCFAALLPGPENMRQFVDLARAMEERTGFRFPYLSGGNCTSYHLVEQGLMPPGINQLRMGGLHLFGIEYVGMRYLPGFHHSAKDCRHGVSNLYLLEAEVIEAGVKPTASAGPRGLDAFLRAPRLVDRGPRRRALLAFGRQDVPVECCVPVDPRVRVLGQTSDHTLVDTGDCGPGAPGVGDTVAFELDYTGLLAACATPGVDKVTVRRDAA